MKTIFSLLVSMSCLLVTYGGYAQDTVRRAGNPDSDQLYLASCGQYLRGAATYNTVVNVFEVVGGTMFSFGLFAETSNSASTDYLAGIGFMIGFGGMEMSKFIPVPLTKARRNLDMLTVTLKESPGYAKLYRDVSTAEILGYTTMALAFIAQGSVLAAAIADESNVTQTTLLWAGVGCTIASIGMSIATTVMISRARISLGKTGGSIGVGVVPDGIGAVYKLP
jgi:hypothetical protein